jgi:hypothetical protein
MIVSRLWRRGFSPAMVIITLGLTWGAAAPPPLDNIAVDAVFADYD